MFFNVIENISEAVTQTVTSPLRERSWVRVPPVAFGLCSSVGRALTFAVAPNPLTYIFNPIFSTEMRWQLVGYFGNNRFDSYLTHLRLIKPHEQYPLVCVLNQIASKDVAVSKAVTSF